MQDIQINISGNEEKRQQKVTDFAPEFLRWQPCLDVVLLVGGRAEFLTRHVEYSK